MSPEINPDLIEKLNESIRQTTDSLTIMVGMLGRAAQAVDALTTVLQEQRANMEMAELVVGCVEETSTSHD